MSTIILNKKEKHIFAIFVVAEQKNYAYHQRAPKNTERFIF
jgi:hypothetical protein